MVRVEILYSEEYEHEDQPELLGFIKSFEDEDEGSAIEDTFQAFLDEKVRGRPFIVRVFRIHVDGENKNLHKLEMQRYIKRIDEASL